MSLAIPRLPAAVDPVPDITGDPDSVEGYAQALVSVAGTYTRLDEDATSEAEPVGWNGAAAEAYSTKVRWIAEQAATLGLGLSTTATGIRNYKDTLAGLQWTQRGLVSQREHYLNQRDDLRARIKVNIEAPESQAKWIERSTLIGLADDLHDERRTLLGDIKKMLTAERTMNDSLLNLLDQYGNLERAAISLVGGTITKALLAEDVRNLKNLTPKQVAAWWALLGPGERAALISAFPLIIGNTPGIPVRDRDAANRIQLDRDIEDLERKQANGTITLPERRKLTHAYSARDALQKATTRTGNKEVFLYAYDPEAFGGDGAVAISIGDPTTADNVATFVPGINTDADTAEENVQYAANIFNKSSAADLSKSNAVIMWIGYDAPSGMDKANTPGEIAARRGGSLLADHIRGLNAIRTKEGSNTIVAHSYGTTTSSFALRELGEGQVDRFIALGSPGLGKHVSWTQDVHTSLPSNVEIYAAKDPEDLVPKLANQSGGIGDRLGALPPALSLTYGLGDDPTHIPGVIDFDSDWTGNDDPVQNHLHYFGEAKKPDDTQDTRSEEDLKNQSDQNETLRHIGELVAGA